MLHSTLFTQTMSLGRKLLVLTFLAAFTADIYAQEVNADGTITYYISSPRFARPLVERWIKEYAKVRPDVHLSVRKGCSNKHNNMQVVTRRGINDGRSVMYFGEYAILPVTTHGSEACKILGNKTLSTERMRAIFFDKSPEDYDNAEDMEIDARSPMKKIVVYSGNDTSSVSSLFAAFYGEQMSRLRGRRISGDDAFLLNAIDADPLGVTFNALPNIYDLKARKLRQNLSLLRMGTSSNVEDVIRNDATLDEVIEALEQGGTEDIPTASIGVAFDSSNFIAKEFLYWIITSGVKYNHQYGILMLDNQVAAQQVSKVNNRDSAQK